MRSKAFLAAAAIAVAGGFAVAGNAGAGGGGAETKVTIKAPGGEIYGKVKSPNLARCADDRKVKAFRQKGSRGGGDDIKIGTDNASLSGDVYRWSIGNPGVPEGKKVYAKAGRIEGCQKDSSKTIRVGG